MRTFFTSLSAVIALSLTLAQSCESPDKQAPKPPVYGPNLYIQSDINGDIYLDGVYTGKQSPDSFIVAKGEHSVGIGSGSQLKFYQKDIDVESLEELTTINVTTDDICEPKTWKVLFVGVNTVRNISGNIVLSYTSEELDAGYEYLKYSFEKYIPPYSFNTVNWEYYRKDIVEDTVVLNHENFFTASIFEKYITKFGIKKGDYDLIITFYRFEGDDDNSNDDDLGHFNGIAWYDYQALSAHTSYFLIRYYRDVKGNLEYAKQNDPGMYVHEWLHTVVEMFYPDRGAQVLDPSLGNGSVLHAIEAYGYRWPWMLGYRDLMRGKILSKEGNQYLGITPETFLECTVREKALNQCP